jgi:hypothetical protein
MVTTVTTINGEVIDKKNSRKIKGLDGEFAYYKIGNVNHKNSGDCFQINNIFYTIDKGRIVWDHTLNQYVLKTTAVFGIVDGLGRPGWFSKTDKSVNVIGKGPEPTPCMTESIAIALGYKKDSVGQYYDMRYHDYSKIFPRQQVTMDYKSTLEYGAKNYIAKAKANFEKYDFKRSKDLDGFYKKNSNLLNTYTFGVELETTRGLIPNELFENLGVVPVRDGSISGLEYVTIPLTGEKGLYAFAELVKLVNHYTDTNYTCSMHVHVGGIPRTESFTLAMFKMGYYMQEELFRMFPSYKRENDGLKRQCYTAPLEDHLMASMNYKSNTPEKVKEDFTLLVNTLTSNHSDFRRYVPIESIKNHPYDPSESAKWHMKERYKWMNLIPIIFTNKQTVEYRIFTVPDTIEKGIFFLWTCLIFTDFIRRNESTVLCNPEVLRGITLDYMASHVTSDSTYKYLLRDRQAYTRNIKVNQGSFFEESSLKVINRIIERDLK